MSKKKPKVTLYRRDEAKRVPQGDLSAAEHQFLRRMVEHGAARYMTNVSGEFHALQVGPVVMPVYVNEPGASQCWLSSPTAQYVGLSRAELGQMEDPRLQRIVSPLLASLEVMIRFAQLEHCVVVNHWLMATDLWPDLPAHDVSRVLDFLKEAYPDKAIIWRCYADAVYGRLRLAFEEAGGRFIFLRPVYVSNPESHYYKRRRKGKAFREDIKLLAKTDYQRREPATITRKEAERLDWLQMRLYTDKYTETNPRYTPEFYIDGVETGWVKVVYFEKPDGYIDTFTGYIEKNGYLYAPLIGYDTSLPQKLGLYRMAAMTYTMSAEELGVKIHNSGGVGRFKELRGSERDAEYSIVVTDHLPRAQRAVWRLVEQLMNTIGKSSTMDHNI